MKHFAFCLLSFAAIMTGCTSQEFDEPACVVSTEDEAAIWGDIEKEYRINVSELSAELDAQLNQEYYKDENGFWYPIDENAKITAQQMNEKIIGHGWERRYNSLRDIREDGSTKPYYVTPGLSGCAGYEDVKFSFHPGYVRRYGKRYWDHDFYYHDESRLDTDAPIIGYTSTEDRDWLMPIKLIDDNTLLVVETDYTYKGNGVYALTGTGADYVLERVSDEEYATWAEKYTVDYWGN